MTWLKFILLILNITCFYSTTSTLINRTAATIESLNSSSGLFIEEISYVKLYDAEWNIISKIDLSYFASETQKIKIIVKNLVDLKFEMDRVTYEFNLNETNAILNEFIKIVNEIEKYNHKWFSQTNEKINNRVKRAAFGPIGELSRALFGTLDEYDETNLEEIFEKLQENNIRNLNLSRMRTSILKTSVERFTNSSKILDQQTNNMNEKISEIKIFLSDLVISKFNMKNGGNLQYFGLSQYSILSSMPFKYRSAIDYLILILQQFLKSQKLFLKSLTVSQVRSSNSPYLISPEILANELKNIKAKVLPMNYALPFEIENENLALFYQMSVIYSQIINGNLYIKYSLPLVRLQKFLMYKITSFPYAINKHNLYSYLIPHNEFIGIDEQSDQFYITLTREEILGCFRTHPDTLLCRNSFPIFNTNSINNCELNILLKRNDTSSCNIRIINSTEDLWIKLEKPNTYLYNLPMPKNLKSVCPNEKSESVEIQNAGIISIKEGCSVLSSSLRITGFQTLQEYHFQSVITPKLQFHINISYEVDRIVINYGYQIPPIEASNIIGDGQTKKLYSISSSINDLIKFEKYSVEKLTPRAMKSDLWWILIIIIIIGAVITFVVLKYGYKICQRIWPLIMN